MEFNLWRNLVLLLIIQETKLNKPYNIALYIKFIRLGSLKLFLDQV